MIIKMHSAHIDKVMKIWLDENIFTHDFIPKSFWYSKFDEVKEAILKSEVYVYLKEDIVVGFIGVVDNYIAGLFVKKEFQGLGIGTKLLQECKDKYQNLSLNVFKNNMKAINFYIKNSFEIKEECINQGTKEIEYFMQHFSSTKF